MRRLVFDSSWIERSRLNWISSPHHDFDAQRRERTTCPFIHPDAHFLRAKSGMDLARNAAQWGFSHSSLNASKHAHPARVLRELSRTGTNGRVDCSTLLLNKTKFKSHRMIGHVFGRRNVGGDGRDLKMGLNLMIRDEPSPHVAEKFMRILKHQYFDAQGVRRAEGVGPRVAVGSERRHGPAQRGGTNPVTTERFL